MKKFIAIITSAVITFSSIIPAQAMTVEDIAAQDSRVTVEDGQATYYAKDYNDIWVQYKNIISDNIRTHSGCESAWVSWDRVGNGYKCKIKKSDLDKFLSEKDWVENWCKENVPNIIGNGRTEEDALNYIANYVYASVDYDYYLYNNQDTTREQYAEEASAYSTIQKRKAVCVGISYMFRALMESVPFSSETGLVDWQAENPKHLKVAVVENSEHCWNAVKTSNDIWIIEDCTAGAGGFTEDSSQADIYKNGNEWIWRY